MRGTYIGHGKMLISPIWGGKMVVPSDDLSVMPDLVINGAFDISLTQYMLRHIKEGSTVVDVGANIGYTTILLGRRVGKHGKVLAFEASPTNYDFAVENVKLNYLSHVDLFQLAVYKEAAVLPFLEPSRFRGGGSLKIKETQESLAINAPFDAFNIIEVNAVSLDEQLRDVGKIDFIKIDIEGGEYNAFLGMEGLLKNRKVDVVSFELNAGALGDELLPLRELLKSYATSHGVSFYIINAEGDPVIEDLEELFEIPHVDSILACF
jgi:FkbM family methyltransferase